jgi:hypothetical protein
VVRFNFGPVSLDVPGDFSLSTIVLAGPPVETKGPDLPAEAGSARPFQSNVIITFEIVSASEKPETYRDRQKEGLRNAGVDVVFIKNDRKDEYEEVSIKGAKDDYGILGLQVIQSPAGDRVRQMQLIAIKESTNKQPVAITIIASHLDGQPFSEVKTKFREIMLSLE